jgi:hypothetical protein
MRLGAQSAVRVTFRIGVVGPAMNTGTVQRRIARLVPRLLPTSARAFTAPSEPAATPAFAGIGVEKGLWGEYGTTLMRAVGERLAIARAGLGLQ